MSQHQAKFTWGAGPNAVNIAGNFNDWSDSATPLKKLDDGSFAADVPLPWGEKQAFKYVVDGEWKVREDEAKEWDAAGNMNNVYTAPHPPAPAAAPAAAAAAPAPATATPAPAKPTPAPETARSTETVPAATKTEPAPVPAPVPEPAAVEPAPVTKTTSAEPATALGSLGAPIAGGGVHAAVPGAQVKETIVTAEPVTATAAVPIEDAPAVTAPVPVKIEQIAATANIGQAPVAEEHKTMQEQVAEYGAGALGALGGVLGGAVMAVEKATGIDLGHGDPISVEEARARGIDVNGIPKVDGETDTTSPAGTKPPMGAIEDLEEKTRQLRMNAGGDPQSHVPMPGGDAAHSSAADLEAKNPTEAQQDHTHDLPAQNETQDEHKEVPMAVITPVSQPDPRKDRTLNAPQNNDEAGTAPMSEDPGMSAEEAKEEAESNPEQSASTTAVEQGKPTAPSSKSVNRSEVGRRPDAPETNLNVDSPPTPAKDPKKVESPATPAKTETAPGDASANSTPASTPAKPAHGKEGTSNSGNSGNPDVRKKKSSFFTKMKHAFSPKDKEKEKK